MAQADGPGLAETATTGWNGTFVARPDSVPEARVLVTGWLRAALPAEDLLIGDVALAVSEACTNVVVHAYPDDDGGDFTVVADRDDDGVRVIVSDTGAGMIPRPDSPGLGLGLPLMASLTDALEVRPAQDGSGTIVTMLFSAAGAARRLPG